MDTAIDLGVYYRTIVNVTRYMGLLYVAGELAELFSTEEAE